MIEIDDIVKRYRSNGRDLVVLDGVSARIPEGALAAVYGSSGSGKSTLLLILGGLLRPDRGRARVAGEDFFALPPGRRGRLRARTLGFVFQRFHLLPYLTVEGNIRSAAVALPEAVDDNRVASLMARFQIEARRDHLPGQLSVGEQQRVALARALHNRPRILLADEPTGNLDRENADIVLAAFREFAAGGGTVVMVTHDRQAAAQADLCWQLRNGQMETTACNATSLA
jgi:putative ABC transport system ATP-binding protein